MLLELIDQNHNRHYDFFYLPIDFKNKCNVGYAFINLIDPMDVARFYREFNGRRWNCFRSGKVCVITYARLQGRQAMITRFQNSSLLNESIEVQPRLFIAAGPDKGQPEPFPGGAPVGPCYPSAPETHHHHHHPATTTGFCEAHADLPDFSRPKDDKTPTTTRASRSSSF